MNPKYESLFTSFQLPSGVQFMNRMLMAPMTIIASGANGEVTDEELAYYRARSYGVGAIITASALVSPNGKLTENGFGIDNDALIPGLKKLAAVIQENGTRGIVQIYHGGRLSNPGLVPALMDSCSSNFSPPTLTEEKTNGEERWISK